MPLGGVGFQLVKFVLENVVDALIRADTSRQGPATGGLQALVGVPFAQPENAQAGAVSLLGMAPALQHSGDELAGVWANFLGPAVKSFG